MNPVQETSCHRGQKRSSKELLYCEYSNSTGSEALIEQLLNGKKKKPEIKFTPSSVLSKVKNFLPELEKAQKELENKSPEEYNLEVVDDAKPVIEMNLELYENATEDCSASEDESDSAGSEDELGDSSSEASDDIILRDCAPCVKGNSGPLIEEIKDSCKD